MAARAISSGTISFGLVSIPVKLYTAAVSEQVSFNMLHKKCKGRVKMQYFCPTDSEVVERADTVKGFEYAKGQYVLFAGDELKALEAERSGSIEITEFVPLSSVDFVHVEKSYYLGADKGGDKAYRLLAETMRESERVAVGRWSARGKEQLVLVRPYGEDGLILHQLFYSNEVRAFDDVERPATFKFSDKERELAQKLIEQLSADAFDASQYHDSFTERVEQAVAQKVAGEEISVAPEAPKAQIIDLFEALKKSLAHVESAGPPLRPPKKAEAGEPEKPKKSRHKG
jgi:DNA end-binding protein Ku